MTDTLAKTTPRYTHVHPPPFRPRLSLFLKRAVDVFVAFWGLVLLAPFFLLVSGMIRREMTRALRSPGCMIESPHAKGNENKILLVISVHLPKTS